MTKAPIDLASHFRWHGQAFSDGQIIDTLTPRVGRRSENNELLRAEPVWDRGASGVVAGGVGYSRKRAVRDNTTLTLQENKARAVVAGQKTARTPRFVTTSKGTPPSTKPPWPGPHARGPEGLRHQHPGRDRGPGEVIASYHDLWHVEASFRMSKTDLRARPMFARTEDAIEAHLTIVFAALAVSGKFKHAPAWHCATCCASYDPCAQPPSPSTAPSRPSHQPSATSNRPSSTHSPGPESRTKQMSQHRSETAGGGRKQEGNSGPQQQAGSFTNPRTGFHHSPLAGWRGLVKL